MNLMGSARSEIGLPHGSTLKVRLVWPRLIKHLGKSYGLDTERGKWLEASAGEADGGASRWQS